MASNITVPLLAGAEVLALNADTPRVQYAYVDGKRSDTPKLHPISGGKAYRVRALLKLSADVAEEIALVIDDDAPLGGALRPVRIDTSTATLSIRPEDAFSLIFTVHATLLREKGA